MFKEKVSVVKNLMVLGKLLILILVNPVYANDISNPRFFEYRSGSFVNRLADISFGWFKTLTPAQTDAYQQSLMHAVMAAETGERVFWYRENAGGYAEPVYTWPNGSGYCRRIHIQVTAHGMNRSTAATACYDNAHDNWRWASNK
jgi:surface antigen